MIRLTVITINLNNKVGLGHTIKSVINQSYSPFEYIIIDGGSSDGSIDILKKYQNRITYYVSEKDTGIYNAMNKGITKARGEYCLFLNSGDTFYNNLVLQNFISSNPSAGIVYGNLLFVYPNGAKRKGIMPSQLSFRHMMQDTLWHPVSFMRRTLLNKTNGFDEQYTIVSDYDFFLKAIFILKVSTKKINETIAVFSQDGISAFPSNAKLIAAERKEVQMKYFEKNEIDEALKVKFSEKINKRLRRRFIFQ
jgi:glycosyltransferase involved in cell wall biosynthesis